MMKGFKYRASCGVSDDGFNDVRKGKCKGKGMGKGKGKSKGKD